MPNLTKVPVECYHCGYSWDLPLQVPIIGAANGDTIRIAPCAIDVECPVCGIQGVNYKQTEATVTAEGIRGLYAVLRSVSLTAEDLEKLTAIMLEARESDTEDEALAERIKTSVPRLRPVLAWITSQKTANVATLIGVLIALVALFGPFSGADTTPARPARTNIECPSGEEQKINELLGQIADELKSALNAPDAPATDNQDQSDRGKHQ